MPQYNDILINIPITMRKILIPRQNYTLYGTVASFIMLLKSPLSDPCMHARVKQKFSVFQRGVTQTPGSEYSLCPLPSVIHYNIAILVHN